MRPVSLPAELEHFWAAELAAGPAAGRRHATVSDADLGVRNVDELQDSSWTPGYIQVVSKQSSWPMTSYMKLDLWDHATRDGTCWPDGERCHHFTLVYSSLAWGTQIELTDDVARFASSWIQRHGFPSFAYKRGVAGSRLTLYPVAGSPGFCFLSALKRRIFEFLTARLDCNLEVYIPQFHMAT